MPQKLSANNSGAVLPKVTLVLAKIAEVLHWCLAGAMLIGAFVTIIRPTPVTEWVRYELLHGETTLSSYGFGVSIINADGTPKPTMIVCFALGSAITFALMAMIFRNVYLILKTAKGKTWFAKGNTPFQQNIVRMFREIGIFFIAVSVMSIISAIVVNLVDGELTTGFNYLSCFIGLVFLCVSQFFNYGTRLEKDLDGLV